MTIGQRTLERGEAGKDSWKTHKQGTVLAWVDSNNER